MASSPNRAVIEGNPRLIASSFLLVLLSPGSCRPRFERRLIGRQSLGMQNVPGLTCRRSLLRCPPIARSKKAPDHKDDNSSYDRADQPGTFTGVIPADCLPQVGGDERTHDSE